MIDMNHLEKYKKGIAKPVSLNGKTENLDSYYIPLDELYFNDRNGRMHTREREYNATHNGSTLSDLLKEDKAKYNEIMSTYIIDSAQDGKKSYKETKESIKENGQLHPGLVLSDGRIVDGNRRYTALLDLYNTNKDPKYGFFECAILTAPESDDVSAWKSIRQTEIMLQNEDPKKDYNAINKYASFYDDVMNDKTKIFDEKEYCFLYRMNKTDFDKTKNIVKIMVDYLEWRERPEEFYILEDEKLDGPIEEIARKHGRDFDSFRTSDIRIAVYEYMTFIPSGNSDRTRQVRNLLESESKHTALFDVYQNITQNNSDNAKTIGKALEVHDVKVESPEQNQERDNIVKEARKILSQAFIEGEYKDKTEKAAHDPIDYLNDCLTTLNKIDINSVRNSPISRKNDFLKSLNDLRNLINSIENDIK